MSSEEDGKEKAKSQMIHGIIALAVIVSLWGIVALLRNAFGVDGNDSVPSNISNMIPGGDSGSSGGSGYDGSGVDNSGGSNDTWNGVGYNNNNTFGDPSTDPSQGGLNTSY